MMTLSQTKLVGLIMKLDLKAREYKMLCDKLDQAKEKNVDPNGAEMLDLLNKFQANNKEIVDIKKQLIELREAEPELEDTTFSEEQEVLLKQYGLEDVFQNKQNKSNEANINNVNIIAKEEKKNFFVILLDKIKKIFRIRK